MAQAKLKRYLVKKYAENIPMECTVAGLATNPNRQGCSNSERRMPELALLMIMLHVTPNAFKIGKPTAMMNHDTS